MIRRQTILIVDDAIEDRKTYRRFLERAPETLLCSIIEAECGEDAILLHKEHHPDCVVLDYHLPDSNGLEIMEALQGNQPYCSSGIVMLTGAGDTKLAVNALQHGAHDYLDKDQLTPDQLRRAVINAIEKVNLHLSLAKEREWLRATLASIGDGVIATDSAGWVLFMNDVASQLTEWSVEEVKGRPLDEVLRVVTGPSRRRARFLPMHGYGGVIEALDDPVLLVTKNGTSVPIDINSAPICNINDDSMGMVLVFRDISERVRVDRDLFEKKERLRITLASIGDGVITTDAAGIIETLNPKAEALTKWHAVEAIGKPIGDILAIVDDGDSPAYMQATRCIVERKIVQLPDHTTLQCRNGETIKIDCTAAPIITASDTLLGAVVVFRDVTERHELTKLISFQASHDALTSLVNRTEFDRRLHLLLTHAKKQRTHALCYMDLDRFKVVNDSCGHSAGDELLRQVTSQIKTKIRERDTFARLGGDEFGVILGDCPFDQALRIAHDIRDTVHDFRFTWDDKVFAVGASIGIVAIDDNSSSASQLIRDADCACYAAKKAGGGRVHVYQSGDHALDLRRGDIHWMNQLQDGLENDRFCLYCQPIVASKPSSSPWRHYEYLLRLRDQNGDLLLPGVFLPAAERNHQMCAIDRWVVRRALACIREALPTHDGAVYAVNISSQSLNSPEFHDFVIRQLQAQPILPHCLCFEIAETAAVANLSAAQAFMGALKEWGCRFSLDDFGSGLSSFTCLKSLPVDYVKIDGMFVKDVHRDPIDCAMVEAIHRVGQLMGIATVAEWVENDAILAKLSDIGVDFAQGIALGSPAPC